MKFRGLYDPHVKKLAENELEFPTFNNAKLKRLGLYNDYVPNVDDIKWNKDYINEGIERHLPTEDWI